MKDWPIQSRTAARSRARSTVMGWLALTALLWWLGVFAVDYIRSSPNPYGDITLLDWWYMPPIYRTGPWVVAPFVLAAVWGFAVLLRKRGPRAFIPGWVIWMCQRSA